VAILDADEFLVLLEARSVPQILRRFEHVPGVTVNWVVFGVNGQQKRSPGLVLELFRSHTLLNITKNRHTKTIVNRRLVARCSVHEDSYLPGVPPQDAMGKPIFHHMFNRQAVHKVLRINHYWTKSVEEFRAKRARGRASVYHPGLIKQMLGEINNDIASV
jgi:hypothetical protein